VPLLIDSVDLVLGPRFNVVSGDNGQGKTNLWKPSPASVAERLALLTLVGPFFYYAMSSGSGPEGP